MTGYAGHAGPLLREGRTELGRTQEEGKKSMSSKNVEEQKGRKQNERKQQGDTKAEAKNRAVIICHDYSRQRNGYGDGDGDEDEGEIGWIGWIVWTGWDGPLRITEGDLEEGHGLLTFFFSSSTCSFFRILLFVLVAATDL